MTYLTTELLFHYFQMSSFKTVIIKYDMSHVIREKYFPLFFKNVSQKKGGEAQCDVKLNVHKTILLLRTAFKCL
jgi:hypothetical protein